MAAVAAFRTIFSPPHARKHHPDDSSKPVAAGSSSGGSHHARHPPGRARSTHHHRHHAHGAGGHHGHHGHAHHRSSHPPAAATIVVTPAPAKAKPARAATLPAHSAMATKAASTSAHVEPTPKHTPHRAATAHGVKADADAEAAAERAHERRAALDFVGAYADNPSRMRADGRLGRAWPGLGVADFSLLKTLGTGTFARVWLARLRGGGDGEQHERVFALKILRKADIVRMKQVEHVRNERLTLGAVAGSPLVTTLAATFADADSLYMLLDYCPGGEIFTYLRRAGRFAEPTARFYAAEITLALEHLHGRGIAYRDLKPENMLLDARGHLKLVDFGFAKLIGKTETYTLCGTPEYLAPEVIHNTGHGTAVDWWALGILLYEFLVG